MLPIHRTFYIFMVFIFFFISVCEINAGITGKITGIVVDKETKNSLIGVNVLVLGTMLGAATDRNGEFVVLRVPPGEYSLRISMIGYREVLVTDVRVSGDLTTRIQMVELEESVLDIGEEVVITAERPLIQMDITTSTQYLTSQSLSRLPVTDAREALMLQAGVFFDPLPVVGGLGGAGRGEPRYAIRGGEQGQIRWYVNGVRTAAIIEGRADRGGSYTNINPHALQEVQLLSGGFSAEYGEAQSGIVSIVMKEGGSRLSGTAEYVYGPPGQRHFGNYLYDQQMQKEYIDNRLPDGSLDPNWWTPYRQDHVYDYRKIPDHIAYISLGGPFFPIGGNPGSFFIAGQFKREAYSLPRPRDTRDLDDVIANILFQPKPNIRVRVTGLYSHEAHTTLQENGDFTNQAKYYRGWGSLLDTYTYLAGINLTHALSPTIFYELKISQYVFDSRERPSEYTELGVSVNPDIWGYQRYNGYPDEPFDAWAPILRLHLRTGDFSTVGSINWQVNNWNFIKAGAEFRYFTMNEFEAYRFPSYSLHPEDWLNRGLHESFNPIQLSAYIQDKMEFESMIINLGLRLDHFNPNRDWFISRDLFNLALNPDFNPATDPDGDQIDAEGRVKYSFDNVLQQPREPTRTYSVISPRFGVSFPISDRTVLHFNYGHFYQMPALDRMLEFNYFRPEYIVKAQIEERERAAQEGREPRHIPSVEGDPERVVYLTIEPLKPERTIMFEAGIRHNFEGIGVLGVTGYYKDMFDQTQPREGLFDRQVQGYDPFRGSIHPSIAYASHFSGDYADARGFEVTFTTLFSRVFTIDANYSFARSTQGRATPGRIRFDQNGVPEYVWDVDVHKRIPIEKTFSRPHIIRVNIYTVVPESFGSSFPLTLLRGMSSSLLYRFVSGQTFTYVGPTDPPDTYDNYRYPPIQVVDLRLEKNLRLGSNRTVTVYTLITNLLNTKNLRSLGDVYFDAGAVQRYVDNGEVSTIDGAGYDIGWQTYYERRRIYMGIRVSF
jgi:hypothetical protein